MEKGEFNSLNEVKSMALCSIKNWTWSEADSQITGLGYDFYQKEEQQRIQYFHGLFFWENMLREIAIEERGLGKQVIRINNKSSILREEVYLKECLIEGSIVSIEILIENEQPNSSVTSSFGNYNISNTSGIYMFMKITNHTLGYEKNDRIDMNAAIELLGHEYYQASERIRKCGAYDSSAEDRDNFMAI